jgi:hypothetical protein
MFALGEKRKRAKQTFGPKFANPIKSLFDTGLPGKQRPVPVTKTRLNVSELAIQTKRD